MPTGSETDYCSNDRRAERGTDRPPGTVAINPGDAGRFVLGYQPPPALSGRTRVRIQVGLADEDGLRMVVTELSVEVLE